jgi:hypothetical protein
MARVGNNLWAVASDESLGVWEARARAGWLVRRDPYDVRFRLRGELHGTDICQRFDWILIDCSRRMSTAAINAFTASDYLMLAGQPQAASQAQVGQLLGWLARLNVMTGACRGLSMLGVVSVGEEAGATPASATPASALSPARISLPAEIAAPATVPAAASPGRGQRWADGVYYFGNAVPRVAVSREALAKEAVAAGARPRKGVLPAKAVAFNGRTGAGMHGGRPVAGLAHVAGLTNAAGLARELKERIAARGKRR